MSTCAIDQHWRHFRRFEENCGGVPQSKMLEAATKYCAKFNHRFENFHEWFYFSMKLDVGTLSNCARIVAWEHGEPFFKRKKKKKGSVPAKDEWMCTCCGAIVRNTPASRYQHKLRCKKQIAARKVCMKAEPRAKKRELKMRPSKKVRQLCGKKIMPLPKNLRQHRARCSECRAAYKTGTMLRDKSARKIMHCGKEIQNTAASRWQHRQKCDKCKSEYRK